MALSEIAKWTKKQRARRRQSQEEAALGIGMSRTWVSSLENDEVHPAIEHCVSLAEWSGRPITEVLSTAGYALGLIAKLRAMFAADGSLASEPAITLTAAQVEDVVARATTNVIRMLREEGWGPAPADEEPPAPPPPSPA